MPGKWTSAVGACRASSAKLACGVPPSRPFGFLGSMMRFLQSSPQAPHLHTSTRRGQDQPCSLFPVMEEQQ